VTQISSVARFVSNSWAFFLIMYADLMNYNVSLKCMLSARTCTLSRFDAPMTHYTTLISKHKISKLSQNITLTSNDGNSTQKKNN